MEPTVQRSIDGDGVETLTMPHTFLNYNKDDAEPVSTSPQIAEYKEPSPVERVDDEIKVEHIEDLLDYLEDTIVFVADELMPEDVVYDDSGAVKYDGQKPRLDLIPQEAMVAMGDMFRHGAEKYEDRNWERGMKWGRMYGSLQRHLTSWWGGDEIDEESGRSHLNHAITCLAMLVAYEQRKIGQDDRRFEARDDSDGVRHN